MAYHNKRFPVPEAVYADTVVWQCVSCNGWARLEFVFEEEPNCPMCTNKMVQDTKNIRIE